MDGLHPGVELLLERARQEADLLSDADGRAAMTTRRYSRSTMVRLRPAAMARSVLPVPALP